MNTWTEDHVKLLDSLVSQNYSATAIAQELGATGLVVTRSSVLGKIHRLRLSGVLATPPKPQRAPPAPPAPQADRRTRFAPPPPTAAAPSLPPINLPAFLPRKPVKIAALAADRCHWPVGVDSAGSHLFCNASTPPGAAQPYCPKHLAVNHRRGQQ